MKPFPSAIVLLSLVLTLQHVTARAAEGDPDATQPEPHQPHLHDNPTGVRASGECKCYNVYAGLGECRNQCYQQNQLVGSECPCLERLNISGSGSCTCYDVYEGLGKCTRKCYVQNDFVGSSCPCPK